MPEKTKKLSVKLEGSKSLAPVKRMMAVKGLEDVPVSLIPIPFYKLVQPGSTGVTLDDGIEATPGQFYLRDTGGQTAQLRFALLRAKRQHREFTDQKTGEARMTTTYGILGMNLENFTPFILGVSVASFSNLGRLMAQYRTKKVEKAWDYPVMATTEKREETKVINNIPQKVKYWVINFKLEEEKLDENSRQLLTDAYEEFAASLDRRNEEEVSGSRSTVERESEVDEIPAPTEGVPF